MTRLGALRDDYNATVEGRPTRFVKAGESYTPNPAFFEWCKRADAWAEQRLAPSPGQEGDDRG